MVSTNTPQGQGAQGTTLTTYNSNYCERGALLHLLGQEAVSGRRMYDIYSESVIERKSCIICNTMTTMGPISTGQTTMKSAKRDSMSGCLSFVKMS